MKGKGTAMIDGERLKDVLVQYKKDFVPKHWQDEKYKWEALKWFQDNWNINVTDFADMLNRSFSQTYNLLASMNNFPAKMITGFAETAPEDVRSMYIDLFDESKDIYERINTFKLQSDLLLENMERERDSIINLRMLLRPICGCVIQISITYINTAK